MQKFSPYWSKSDSLAPACGGRIEIRSAAVFGFLAKEISRGPVGAWVPGGTRVYAVGDVHGRLDLLEGLHREIRRHADAHPADRRVIVYMGDYVDRGPDSRGVVDLLIDDPMPGFESVHLMGNHESFLLQFLEDPGVIKAWLMNGGDATLRSFGIDPFAPTNGSERGVWLQRQLSVELSAEEERFFRSLRVQHVEGDYLFVHAGIRPGVPLEAQDPFDMMWIREPFLSSGEDFGKIVVHGHTPTGQPDLRANRIGVDTGAVYGGVLTALVLEGETREFIQI